jgi:hypothetical protein
VPTASGAHALDDGGWLELTEGAAGDGVEVTQLGGGDPVQCSMPKIHCMHTPSLHLGHPRLNEQAAAPASFRVRRSAGSAREKARD